VRTGQGELANRRFKNPIVRLEACTEHSVVFPNGLLSRHFHGSLGKMVENHEPKGEYGGEVGSRASSQLIDSRRKTPAPVNYYQVTLSIVNRRVVEC
jgi:hypothetical protein